MCYCSKCQVLAKTGVACPSCGSKKLREVQANDPVLICTADELKCSMIRAAFDESGIPHEERMCGPGAPPSVLYGRMPSSLYHVFVPYGEMEHCEEILIGIGVLGENGTSKPDKVQTQEEDLESGSMSRRKRIFVRIASAIAFLILVWVVVTLADTCINFIKSAFSNLYG